MDESMLTPMGPVKYKTKQIAREVVSWCEANGMRVRNLWGYDPNASNTEHHSGLAIDFMLHNLDDSTGDHICEYLLLHRERLGLQHMIWKQRIMSTDARFKPLTWVQMEDRGSTTNNHRDHVHAMFYPAPESIVPIKEDDDLPYTEDQLINIVRTGLLGIKWGDKGWSDLFIETLTNTRAMLVENAALKAAVSELKTGTGDPQAIAAAIDKAVKDAVAKIKVTA